MIPKELKIVSKRKQKLIDEYYHEPYKVGERILVPKEVFGSRYDGNADAVIQSINTVDKTLDIIGGDGSISSRQKTTISFDDVIKRNEFEIGANPFTHSHSNLRFVAYSLDSILFSLDVFDEKKDQYKFDGIVAQNTNWNPFVYLPNGEKEYYQRPFVWTLKEKQLLIDSIYNDIDLGKVVVRKRGWQELERMRAKGETEIAFNDIVDGKQRLHAIAEFCKGNFKDSHGNYFGDLSAKAQHQLTSNQLLSYAEMPENSKDKDVLEQFLKLNFAGIPQSEEHIEFVRKLHNKI